MANKPYQSCLIPHEDEIFTFRRGRPPVSYARIAELLLEKYGLRIRRETIFKFIKVRSRGRKVYGFCRTPTQNPVSLPAPLVNTTLPQSPSCAPLTPQRRLPEKLEFMPMDRYRLTRLPPEEAAAIRKKLEEKGH